MKTERRDGTSERAVLIGMCVDKGVVRGIAARVKAGTNLFASPSSNIVAKWCIEHYRRFGKPPGRALITYFDQWQQGQDEDTVRLVEKFLKGLSAEYERNGKAPAADYLLDLAGKLFTKVQFRNLQEEIGGKLESNDVDGLSKLLNDFRKIEVGTSAGTPLLKGIAVIKTSFEERQQPIVRFRQPAADAFFSHSLAREEFIAFMGKAKVGKSYLLMELAFQAVFNKRRVAFFEVGDQSQNQLIRRFGARAAGIPIHEASCNRDIEYPLSIAPGEDGGAPQITPKIKHFKKPVTWQQAWAALKRIGLKYGKDLLRLSVHPNSSISMAGIEAILGAWESEGFVPDVVIIDYADILAPMDGRMDSRDAINATWKAMRRLNQQLHCLLITATQSDSASYDTNLLKRKNFADDRRKFDHVTGMVGINQRDDEKKRGVYRLNWILGRDLDFGEDTCLYTAGCLAVANPLCCSTFDQQRHAIV